MAYKVEIGNATLYCGDCMDIIPALGPIDAVVTDPPFGMCFVSNSRREETKHKAIHNDDSEELLKMACNIDAKHSSYIFCRWDNLPNVKKPKSLITWVKNNHSMGDLYHEHARKTEVVLFYPGQNHFFTNGRPTDVIFADRTGNEIHPTQKPVSLMKQIVSFTDGCIFDPFMGSGTTGVAAVQMGLKFIGIELDPDYFKIACKRIEDAQRQGDLFL